MAELEHEILDVLRGYGGGGLMTYVVANMLRMTHKHHNGTLDTPRVFRRLMALEKRGVVERIRSSYARQICWRVKKNAEQHKGD